MPSATAQTMFANPAVAGSRSPHDAVPSAAQAAPVLQIEDLHVHFKTQAGTVRAAKANDEVVE